MCPATGESVIEAFPRERRYLGSLPALPEPFDISVTRPVNQDAIVHFEGRQYHLATPLGRMGKALQAIAGTPTEQRPVDVEESPALDRPRGEDEAARLETPYRPVGGREKR